MEFKGTKGNWVLHKKAYCCVMSEKTENVIANCGSFESSSDYDKLYIEQKANALLISKAPEMLTILSLIMKTESLSNACYEDIKKLIKEATEL